MSTRWSFGYNSDGPPETHYHLFEDFDDPRQVFLQLPLECLDETDSGTVTLRITPAMWDAIRQHACPGNCSENWQASEPEAIQKFIDSIKAKKEPTHE